MRLFLPFAFLLHTSQSAILFQGTRSQIRAVSRVLSTHPPSYSHSHFRIPSRYHTRAGGSTVATREEDRISGSQRNENDRIVESIEKVRRVKKSKRSIANAVIESAHCEHVDLVDCSDLASDEMTCMLTATGMTCCVCTATLRQMNEWKVFG